MGISDKKAFMVNFKFSFISIIIQILISFYFWKFANINELDSDFNLTSIIMYFLSLSILTLAFIPAMYTCYEVFNSINSGVMIVWISRPINFVLMTFFEKLGVFVITSIVPIIAYILIYIFVYKSFSMLILYGIISSFFGFIILFLIQMVLGLLSFWVKKTITLRDFVFQIFAILGGSLMPIDFFPSFIQKLSLYSPFAYVYYVPSKILSGALSGDVLVNLGVQILWILILFSASQLLYNFGKKRTVQGG